MSDYMKYPKGVAMTTEPKGGCTKLLRELFRSDLTFMYMLFKVETLMDIATTCDDLIKVESDDLSKVEREECAFLIESLFKAIDDLGSAEVKH